jgi:hypothetical protein
VFKGLPVFVFAQIIWCLTPFAPAWLLAAMLPHNPSPLVLKSAVIASVAILAPTLTVLSIWGGSKARRWLNTVKPRGPAALLLVLWAAFAVTVVQSLARLFPRDALRDVDEAIRELLVLYLVYWALLLAYQSKTVWDYARDAWDVHGWRWLLTRRLAAYHRLTRRRP